MLDTLRASLHRALTTNALDAIAPVRVGKDLALRANRALGAPLASREDLAARNEARARLARSRSGDAKAKGGAAERPQAPVMVYFEKGRNTRMVTRVEELLTSKGVAFQRLDVAGDEATLDFVMHKSGCAADELPIVFVAGEVIGTYERLVSSDVSGDFDRILRGEPKR